MRRIVIALASFAVLGGCASTPQPVNAALSAPANAPLRSGHEPGAQVLVLALSGGGARAASFSFGVLQGLRAMHGRDGRPLTQHVALISAVSGGSLMAAYYGLHGDAGLDGFRSAYLDKEWRLSSLYAPTTWLRAADGGSNDGHAEWLDRELYAGARMDAMGAGPRVILNATDLASGAPFAFTPLFFDALCSDLASFRVADAAAASMAVPFIFHPVLLATQPRACNADMGWTRDLLDDRAAPEMARATARAMQAYRSVGEARYLHLSDGGVADNFGLTTLTLLRAAGPAPAPFTPRETIAAREIVFLVVNAEMTRDNGLSATAEGPGGVRALGEALDIAVEAAKRSALDAFRASLPDLQRELMDYRCGLSEADAQALGAGADWLCDDISVALEMITLRDSGPDAPDDLIETPTLVSLPGARVDALIAAGRYAVTQNESVRALTE